MDESFKRIIKAICLDNYFTYKTISDKSVIGKAISLNKNIKNNFKENISIIKNIIDEVNNLSEKEKIKEYEDLKGLINNNKDNKKDKSKKNLSFIEVKELPEIDLSDLKENEFPKFRFAPSPTGYLHIGHSYNIIYNYYYSKKYNGEFILRIEDTNPDKLDEEFYNSIIEDVKWLTNNNIKEICYQSDRLKIYYEYAERLIKLGKAYVCTCESELFRNLLNNRKECPCRSLSINEHLKRFNDMFNKYKPGEAVLRFKANLEDPNPALRDFPLMRINETPHIRITDKSRVWPLYNFSTAIDDSLMNITHIIRGKDGEINGIRQNLIKEALNLRKSIFIHIGRVQFNDLDLGKTPIKEKIMKGIYEGWDDPRVPTLVSFRKRGFKPGAFYNMIISMGISKRDSKISFKDFMKNLIFHNKQIIDKTSKRFFFISNPIKVYLKGNYKKTIKLPKHPTNKDFDERIFNIKDSVYIDKNDLDVLNVTEKERIIRLMHFGNFKISRTEDRLFFEFISEKFDKSLKAKLIHFLPALDNKCMIIDEENNKIDGFSENLDIKIDEIIQFERFGFCRLDRFENQIPIFYFTHK